MSQARRQKCLSRRLVKSHIYHSLPLIWRLLVFQMFCLEGMVWDLPGDCCLTNEKHTVHATLSCSSHGWLAKQQIEYLDSFNCNLLAYVYFPSQEQHSLCSEDLPLDSGRSRHVSLVLQLIHPCVVRLLILQMTHCHFPECEIKYIGKKFFYLLVSLSCSQLIFTQEAGWIYFAFFITF